MSWDPVGYEGSESNLYEYVGGSALTHSDPNGLWPWSTECCNGISYKKATHCCENNKVVRKKSIWICWRPLGVGYGIGTGLYWGLPTNYVFPHCYQEKHSYVCCSGDNKNCYGKQKDNKKGSPIRKEEKADGTCYFRTVCPATWTSKCVNPVANEDYGVIMPGYENCTDWAWCGLK